MNVSAEHLNNSGQKKLNALWWRDKKRNAASKHIQYTLFAVIYKKSLPIWLHLIEMPHKTGQFQLNTARFQFSISIRGNRCILDKFSNELIVKVAHWWIKHAFYTWLHNTCPYIEVSVLTCTRIAVALIVFVPFEWQTMRKRLTSHYA